jgi:hypothetical protein
MILFPPLYDLQTFKTTIIIISTKTNTGGNCFCAINIAPLGEITIFLF